MDNEKTIEPGTCGWAPGNYCCRCCRCGDEFIGDKRAVICVRCAKLLQVIVENKRLLFRAEKAEAEAERLREESTTLRKNIEAAVDYAAHRWSEWGSRAETVIEMIEAALTEKK